MLTLFVLICLRFQGRGATYGLTTC